MSRQERAQQERRIKLLKLTIDDCISIIFRLDNMVNQSFKDFNEAEFIHTQHRIAELKDILMVSSDL